MAKYKNICEIIPQKTPYYNHKKTILTDVLRDENNPHTRRVTNVKISEEAFVDLKQFHKLKDIAMMNILLEFMPVGTSRDILIEALTTGNKKNIVFDTTKEKKPFTSVFAAKYNVSIDSVQKAIARLVKLELVIKLNKYQYMLNPYQITRNDLKVSKIAELQHYWDQITEGKNTIKTPITWIESETNENSFETRRDMHKVLETVEQSDADYRELKRLKKQHLQEDIQTLSDPDTKAKYRSILLKFIGKYDYIEAVQKEGKLPTKVIQHFAKYVRKGLAAGWDIFNDVEPLHLDGTYRPIRLLDEE